MTRSERLLAIMQAMRARRSPVTAGALAERFGVSERTIYRDVATLNRRGATIEGGAGFGYVLRGDAFLPPLTLDVDEAAAVMLGLRFVLRRGDGALARAAASARAKLAAVAPAMADDASASSPLLVAPRPVGGAETLGVVRDALARGRKLRIAYTDSAGRTSERVVWPVVLGWFDGLEMLAAWCETRDAFRHFRIDRTDAAVATEERPPRSLRSLLADYERLEPKIVR